MKFTNVDGVFNHFLKLDVINKPIFSRLDEILTKEYEEDAL